LPVPLLSSTQQYRKLSCRREAARCFVSLNILLSHSKSLKWHPWVSHF